MAMPPTPKPTTAPVRMSLDVNPIENYYDGADVNNYLDDFFKMNSIWSLFFPADAFDSASIPVRYYV